MQLQNTLEMIRENLNPDVQIEGILPTMLDTRTVHAKEAVEILEENFGDLVFKSRIKKAIKFAEAPVKGSSVLKYDPRRQRGAVLPRPCGGGPDDMARPKRASMREGPLADLFRSTEAPDDPPEPPERPPTRRERDAEQPTASRRRRGDRRARRARGPADEATARRRPTGRPAPPRRGRRRARAPPAARRAASPRTASATSSAADRDDREPAYGRSEPSTSSATDPPVVHDPVIRVIGVGGGGVNAVNRMVEAGIAGVEFMAVNTDLQSLQQSAADLTVHIGGGVTRGLGSGSDPELGYRAAFEEQDRIKRMLKGSDMVFVAAGAGGGTGTGAAPVIARLARDVGALTVGIVTRPFGVRGHPPRQAGREGHRSSSPTRSTR